MRLFGIDPDRVSLKDPITWIVIAPLFVFVSFGLESGFEYYKITNMRFDINDTSVSVCNPLFLPQISDVHISRMILTLNYDNNKMATAEISKEIMIGSGITKHFPILGLETQSRTYVENNQLIKDKIMPTTPALSKLFLNITAPMSQLKYFLIRDELFQFTLPERPYNLDYMQLKATFTMKVLQVIPIPIPIDRELQTSLKPTTMSYNDLKPHCT